MVRLRLWVQVPSEALNKRLEEFVREVRINTISRSKVKYSRAYTGIDIYSIIHSKRGKLMRYYYALMRYLDDIVDGDIKLNKKYISSKEYIGEMIDFSLNPIKPQNVEQEMIVCCYNLSHKIGI